MLLVKTKLGPSKIHGMGLFAAEPIKAGTVIWRFVGGFDHLLDAAFVDSLPDLAKHHMSRFCGLLENGQYLQTGDNDRFINHSATPNTLTRPFLEDLVAARDIPEGEEITEDYRIFDFSEERKAYTGGGVGDERKGQGMSFCPQCGDERPPGARGLYCRENGKNCKRDRDRQVRNTQKECRLCGKVPRPLAKALWKLYNAEKRHRPQEVEAAMENIKKVREELKAARLAKRTRMGPTTTGCVETAAHSTDSQETQPAGVV